MTPRRIEDEAAREPEAGQETIRMTSAERYLETLEEMLRAAETRNDPTLAIAVSPRMLRLLLTAAGREP